MRTYEIRHRESNRKGCIGLSPTYTWRYRCSEDEALPSLRADDYKTLREASLEWNIPRGVKWKLAVRAHLGEVLCYLGSMLAIGVVVAAVAVVLIFFCHTWDYRTGQDTGYISAVDKMAWSDDYTIYLRRRPLDAQGYTVAEKDETTYCTTADREEVVNQAYEAMTTGERVILVYDTPKEFGWRAIGHCNSAPITEIRYVKESKEEKKDDE